jgi:hypothetical protein
LSQKKVIKSFHFVTIFHKILFIFGRKISMPIDMSRNLFPQFSPHFPSFSDTFLCIEGKFSVFPFSSFSFFGKWNGARECWFVMLVLEW